MTPNLGGSWIDETKENSNIRMDVYHISMDINDDRTKEEMQNIEVREQLTKWIAKIEAGERK
jgi:elongation factor P hydroxylase